jgi:5-methylcytosine-specific restriction endonuclease McrA
MARRPQHNDPESLRAELVDLLTNFQDELRSEDLRSKVLALIPAFHQLRDLGCSLIPREHSAAARDRILYYLLRYPFTVISGEELMVVSGIQEWARRLRELRVQFGWPIVSGLTASEMAEEAELPEEWTFDPAVMGPDDYALLGETPDRDAAYRWNVANEIRRRRVGVRAKILEFLRRNVGKPVTGEELRYVAGNRTEWARRVRELRTELGWPIATRNTGRPDLPIGAYVLEADRQSPEHDRKIPDPVRREVLRRDGYKCQDCGWTHEAWNPSDPRHLELHHVKPHVEGGSNLEENLLTLCTVCHDQEHRQNPT